MFTNLTVNGAGVGDLCRTRPGDTMSVEVRVACASWGKPNLVQLFQNGKEIASRKVVKTEGLPLDETFSFSIPTPEKDAWLVAVVRGDKPENPWWAVLADTGALTNPIRLDVNGDGKWTSPLETKVRTLSEPKL